MTGKKEKHFPLPISVIAVFTAANGLIRAPFSSGSLWGFALALLSGICFLPLLLKTLTKISVKRDKFVYRAVLSVLAALSFLPAIFAVREYCEFVYRAVLPHADMWLILALFTACVLYLAVSGDSALYKFGFLSFILMSAVFSVLFLMSAKTFDFDNLAAAFDISRFSIKDAVKNFLTLILPSAAAVFYFRVSDKKNKARAVLWGSAAGALLCVIVVLDSVLSFGLPLAAGLDYPYIDDISTVTAGSLFTRMDAFSYFAFFAAYVLKAALCIKTSARLISRAGACRKNFKGIRTGCRLYHR